MKIPAECRRRKKKSEMAKDDLGNKPQEIKEKIVEGRIQKRLKKWFYRPIISYEIHILL